MDQFENFVGQTTEFIPDFTADGDVMAAMAKIAEQIAIEDDELKTIEADLKARKGKLQVTKGVLCDLLIENNCQNGHKFDNGILVKPTIKQEYFCQKEVDEQTMFTWLRANNLGDIIKETVFWQTLNATLKTEVEAGRNVPGEIFNLRETTTIRFAGNGKAKFLAARKGL